jgi:chemotaxis protein methyltransferase CheR
MRDSDFEFIRTLVYERSRISLDSSKRELVSARVAKRLRANKMESVSDYCEMLRDPNQEDERARLIDAVSTNHTYFFREPEHFNAISKIVLPDMLERTRTQRWRRFHAWSAACSSGEEPYSLAITLAEGLAASRWPWKVEATDISHRMLEAAQAGNYSAESVDNSVPTWARGHFRRGIGPQEGKCRVEPSIRTLIGFVHLNLLDPAPLPFGEPFHLILCRNVMIYFDRPTQVELVRRLAEHLVPGGYLMVGHSESLAGVDHGLETVGASIYRRPMAAQ